jgi:flagellar protein FliJ
VRRFRFNLEKLLELRAFYERKAEMVLAEKAGACALLDARLLELAQSRVRTGREMFQAGRGLADYRAAELYLVRLDRESERISRELAAAELEREQARLAYVEKRMGRESLEKIKERRQAEHYRLAEREETKALDDLARRRPVESRVLRVPSVRRDAVAKG